MAGKNRNSFLKRQKEIERMRKAREKMARRHNKRARAAEQSAETQEDGAELAVQDSVEGEGTPAPGEHVGAEELVLHAE